jgi:hypothetical protein
LQKGTEVIVPEIETDQTLKKQTVALAHIRRDNRSNEITTGEDRQQRNQGTQTQRNNQQNSDSNAWDNPRNEKISQLKGTTEHVTFVKIEAISKEHAENTKDGVPKVQGKPKP